MTDIKDKNSKLIEIKELIHDFSEVYLDPEIEGCCSEEITDMFTFYETEDGFIIPKSMIDRLVVQAHLSEGADERAYSETIEPKESIQEQRQKEKEERLADLKEKAKIQKTNENQLGLFDN